MRKTGTLIILSGFAGTGKGTIVKKLLADYPDEYALSVSATTRKPRPGEVDGRDYFFKTEEEFDQMIEHGELLEYARYVEHSYGTPRDYVDQKLAEGKNVLLEIEMQGALSVKERFPDTLMLFVAPPSIKDLVERLRGRGTETEEEIRSRLTRAIEEARGSASYDYLIINDDLDETVKQMHQLILNERCRMEYCRNEIETMEEDLMKYLKGETI